MDKMLIGLLLFGLLCLGAYLWYWVKCFVPKQSLWDSVYFDPPSNPAAIRKAYGLLRCTHETTVKYVRIDHRAGPGCYADNFEGYCCTQCGRIFIEEQTL